MFQSYSIFHSSFFSVHSLIDLSVPAHFIPLISPRRQPYLYTVGLHSNTYVLLGQQSKIPMDTTVVILLPLSATPEVFSFEKEKRDATSKFQVKAVWGECMERNHPEGLLMRRKILKSIQKEILHILEEYICTISCVSLQCCCMVIMKNKKTLIEFLL